VWGSGSHTHYLGGQLVFSHDRNVWVASPTVLPVVVEVVVVHKVLSHHNPHPACKLAHIQLLLYDVEVYSGSKKCPNVCMIWKDQIGVIC
jgi:hypothetical protein